MYIIDRYIKIIFLWNRRIPILSCDNFTNIILYLQNVSRFTFFRCHACSKAFSQAANLTAHARTHSGEKPFRCPVCDRRFSQSSSVTTHMRTHSGERPYRCVAPRYMDYLFTRATIACRLKPAHIITWKYLYLIACKKVYKSGMTLLILYKIISSKFI